jgi:Domain of unknown function (DUF4189)
MVKIWAASSAQRAGRKSLSLYRLAVVFGFLTGVRCAPASADCVSECQAATYCDSEMHASGECADRLNACYINECNRVRYGAIAYDSESGAYGWSNDLYNGPDAEKQALANCRDHGEGCKVVVDFWDSCGAVAADDSGHFGSAYADSRKDAETKAIDACQSDSGESCEIKVWSCARP